MTSPRNLLPEEAAQAEEPIRGRSLQNANLSAALGAARLDLVRRLELKPGIRLLDLTCDNPELALMAARRGSTVSCVGLAGDFIAAARCQGEAEGRSIDFDTCEADALPFPGCNFDCVVSFFGVMFARRPALAAAELTRVTKSGGRMVLANWTPEGFPGKMFKLLADKLPGASSRPCPLLWGDEEKVQRFLAAGFSRLHTTRQRLPVLRGLPAEAIEFFLHHHEPLRRAFVSLEPATQITLRRELLDEHTAHPETEVEYLEVVAVRG